jgi:hypothetical protein
MFRVPRGPPGECSAQLRLLKLSPPRLKHQVQIGLTRGLDIVSRELPERISRGCAIGSPLRDADARTGHLIAARQRLGQLGGRRHGTSLRSTSTHYSDSRQDGNADPLRIHEGLPRYCRRPASRHRIRASVARPRAALAAPRRPTDRQQTTKAVIDVNGPCRDFIDGEAQCCHPIIASW